VHLQLRDKRHEKMMLPHTSFYSVVAAHHTAKSKTDERKTEEIKSDEEPLTPFPDACSTVLIDRKPVKTVASLKAYDYVKRQKMSYDKKLDAAAEVKMKNLQDSYKT
jgi:hypothetical protein